jgi:hypothetical protein
MSLKTHAILQPAVSVDIGSDFAYSPRKQDGPAGLKFNDEGGHDGRNQERKGRKASSQRQENRRAKTAFNHEGC